MSLEDNRWSTTTSMLLRPRLLLQGVVEYASAWFFTRRWWWLILVYSPVLLIVLASTILVGMGSFTPKQDKVEQYLEWISEEMPLVLSELDSEEQSQEPGNDDEAFSSETSDEGQEAEESQSSADSAEGDIDHNLAADETTTSEESKSITRYGEILLRRLLQLNNENTRATYLVANQLYRQGRTGQAESMMRRVAPEGGGGFAPAHAWLAADQLQSGEIKTQEDWDRFKADMESALSWSFISPQLIGIYANQLATLATPAGDEVQRENIDRALTILGRASKQHPELQINLANLAAKFGRKQRLQRVAKDVKERIRARIEEGIATPEDLTSLGNLFLLEGAPDRALTTCQMGFELDPQNAALKRIQSEAFRIKYLQSLVVDAETVNVNLSYLDAALKSDPTNPGVSLEIAKLMAAGKDTPPEMKEALQKQVAGGQATALAHILLADRYILDSQIEQAIPHLEAALTQAPNNPLVLNNLGLAIAKTTTDNERLERALGLAQQAVSLAPNEPEYRDTLGEIQWLTGDKLGALASYEAVLSQAPNRVETRRSLVRLYQELGMTDMADIQEAEIESLLEKSSSPEPDQES